MPKKKDRKKKSNKEDEASNGEDTKQKEAMDTILCCIKVKKGTTLGQYISCQISYLKGDHYKKNQGGHAHGSHAKVDKWGQRQKDVDLTQDEKSKRARENWAKLKAHIVMMKYRANYFSKFINDDDEVNRQNKNGDGKKEQDGFKDQKRSNGSQTIEDVKNWQQNLIINPNTTDWLQFWDFVMDVALLYGYIYDPYYIAFYIAHGNNHKPTPKEDMMYQIIIDIILVIDIIFQSLTTFQNKENIWETSLLEIFKNYVFKGSFILDALGTIPTLVTSQSHGTYLWKLIRLKKCQDTFSTISMLIEAFLNRIGVYKGSIGKIVFSLMLIVYLISACHFIGCTWISLAKMTECSWLEQGYGEEGNERCEMGIKVDVHNNSAVYITAMYWVVTTLTTVGYGDYKGYTPVEYGFQMLIEFLGIGVFSFLMGAISDLFSSDITIQEIVDARIEETESWLRTLEKARPKNFSKQLNDAVKEFTEKSYYYDYSGINNHEFFKCLKPRMRHRLINGLFGEFINNFFYLFNDNNYEAGQEFISDFVTQIKSKVFMPDNEIVNYGESFDEMIMIQESVVSCHLRLDKFHKYRSKYDGNFPLDKPLMVEFFILPTYSYFGDYQILYDLKSQITYKAGNDKKYKLMIALSISKENLIQLMNDYPDARKFYFEMSFERRIEFRRRMQRFYYQLEDQNIIEKLLHADVDDCSSYWNQSEDEGSDYDSEHDDQEGQEHEKECNNTIFSDDELECSHIKLEQKKALNIYKCINEKVSKFYANVDECQEFEHDVDTDELESMSEDERQEDMTQLLDEDNKKYSQSHAKSISQQMILMSEIYISMSGSLDCNFEKVKQYVHKLQTQEGPSVTKNPQLRKLEKILSQIQIDLDSSDLTTQRYIKEIFEKDKLSANFSVPL